jgi:hypothetical protein
MEKFPIHLTTIWLALNGGKRKSWEKIAHAARLPERQKRTHIDSENYGAKFSVKRDQKEIRFLSLSPSLFLLQAETQM